jgi:hypothetical protein
VGGEVDKAEQAWSRHVVKSGAESLGSKGDVLREAASVTAMQKHFFASMLAISPCLPEEAMKRFKGISKSRESRQKGKMRCIVTLVTHCAVRSTSVQGPHHLWRALECQCRWINTHSTDGYERRLSSIQAESGQYYYCRLSIQSWIDGRFRVSILSELKSFSLTISAVRVMLL